MTTYFFALFPPTLAVLLLATFPVLTVLLMRRAGIRGPKLFLAAIPPAMLVLGGFVFQLMMAWQQPPFDLLKLAMAKTVAISFGALSPLLILAIVKWPVLNNSRIQVEANS